MKRTITIVVLTLMAMGLFLQPALAQLSQGQMGPGEYNIKECTGGGQMIAFTDGKIGTLFCEPPIWTPTPPIDSPLPTPVIEDTQPRDTPTPEPTIEYEPTPFDSPLDQEIPLEFPTIPCSDCVNT